MMMMQTCLELPLWAVGRKTCTGGNKTLPPSMSLPVMGKIAGINMASLGGCLHNLKTRDR